MSMSKFLKRNHVVAVIAGVLSAVLTTRFEPFRSNFYLAILAGIAVGIASAMIVVAIRDVAQKLKQPTR